MNGYHCAVTTAKSRLLIVERYESGWRQGLIAESLGISRRTVCKWLKRWRSAGVCGLKDRTSKPHSSPRKLPASCEQTIVHLRKSSRMIARNIAIALQIPPSTVSLVLKRHSIGRLQDIDPKQKAIRYERDAPGDLIHIDIKKVGIIAGIGHRFTAGKRNNRTERKQGTGWEYIHAAVDDYSRMAYAEILPDESAKTSCAFLIRAARFFKEKGIKIWRVMTDNGPGYISKRYRRMLQKLSIRHIRTKPYTPQTNGKVERFNRTMKDEWLYKRPYLSSLERKNALIPFLDFYNNYRQHAGIKYLTPAARL